MKRVKIPLKTKDQGKVLLSLCEVSAVLWNKVNYKRRQSFFAGSIDWGHQKYEVQANWFGNNSTNNQEEQ